MAKVEIEESELLNMQHIARVTNTIMGVPEARQQYLRLVKGTNPTLSIPEVDAAAPVIAALGASNKKMDEFIAASQAADAERQKQMSDFLAAQETARLKAEEDKQVAAFQKTWADQELDLRKQGWRDSGLKQVREFAEANNIADLSIAADAFERRNPQPGPVESRPGWNLFTGPQQEDTFVKDQMAAKGDSDERLDREIAETLAEIRAGY